MYILNPPVLLEDYTKLYRLINLNKINKKFFYKNMQEKEFNVHIIRKYVSMSKLNISTLVVVLGSKLNLVWILKKVEISNIL